MIVLGEDWNCTVDPSEDTAKPHPRQPPLYLVLEQGMTS